MDGIDDHVRNAEALAAPRAPGRDVLFVAAWKRTRFIENRIGFVVHNWRPQLTKRQSKQAHGSDEGNALQIAQSQKMHLAVAGRAHEPAVRVNRRSRQYVL